METYTPLLKELRGFRFAAFVAIVLASILLVIGIILLALSGIVTDIANRTKISHSGCTDYNDCTTDYKKDPSGCIFLPKQEGESCRSECHNVDALDLRCQTDQVTPGTFVSTCVSPSQENCKGFCLNDVDCGTISSIIGDLAGVCHATTCYYMIDPTGGVTIQGAEVPDLSCSLDYQVFQTTCRSFLNKSDTIIKSNCIVSDVQCQEVTSTLGPVEAAMCYYYYGCSVQQYIPDILLTRSLSRTESSGENRATEERHDQNKDTEKPFKMHFTDHTYIPKNRRKNASPPPLPIVTHSQKESALKKQPKQEPNVAPTPKLGIKL